MTAGVAASLGPAVHLFQQPCRWDWVHFTFRVKKKKRQKQPPKKCSSAAVLHLFASPSPSIAIFETEPRVVVAIVETPRRGTKRTKPSKHLESTSKPHTIVQRTGGLPKGEPAVHLAGAPNRFHKIHPTVTSASSLSYFSLLRLQTADLLRNWDGSVIALAACFPIVSIGKVGGTHALLPFWK